MTTIINIRKDGTIIDDMSAVAGPVHSVLNEEAMTKAEQSTIEFLRKMTRNEKKS